jgi:hypothetical protein
MHGRRIGVIDSIILLCLASSNHSDFVRTASNNDPRQKKLSFPPRQWSGIAMEVDGVSGCLRVGCRDEGDNRRGICRRFGTNTHELNNAQRRQKSPARIVGDDAPGERMGSRASNILSRFAEHGDHPQVTFEKGAHYSKQQSNVNHPERW